MASECEAQTRAAAVARVATRLFGVPVTPDAVIDESLEPATDAGVDVARKLGSAIDAGIPGTLSDEDLRRHPLAAWIEVEIGLRDGQRLSRREPTTVAKAAERLSEVSGRDQTRCVQQIQAMLTLMSRPSSERGGVGEALTILLDTLRHGLAVTADALDPAMVDITATAARQPALRTRDPPVWWFRFSPGSAQLHAMFFAGGQNGRRVSPLPPEPPGPAPSGHGGRQRGDADR